jgi:hypothetical protein
MRYRFNARTRDTYGNVVGYVDIYIYLAGTNTPAKIYTVKTGGSVIETVPQVSSDQYGYLSFFVDDNDYDTSQMFDITISGIKYEEVDVFTRGPAGKDGTPGTSYTNVTGTLSSWTASGSIYYSDLNISTIGSTTFHVECFNNSTDQVIYPYEMIATSTSNLRVWMPVNTVNVRVIVSK